MHSKYYLIILISLISCVAKKSDNCSKISVIYQPIGDRDSTVQGIVYHSEKNDDDYVYEDYYSNGKLRSRSKYSEEKLVEVFVAYDSIGRILDHGSIKNGEGYAIIYHENGIVKTKGYYSNGNRNGWWMRYDYSGRFNDSILYIDGEISDLPGVKLNKY